MCLGAGLLHNLAISFVPEYHNHPTVRHLSTHQGISLTHVISTLYYTQGVGTFFKVGGVSAR